MKNIIKFDKTNPNTILIFEDNKLINMIACPPTDFGCDIINFSDTLNKGYTFDFKGWILITDKKYRKLYCKGKLIAQIKREQSWNKKLVKKWMSFLTK